MFQTITIGIAPLPKSQDSLNCTLCGIKTETKEQLSIHMVKVIDSSFINI